MRTFFSSAGKNTPWPEAILLLSNLILALGLFKPILQGLVFTLGVLLPLVLVATRSPKPFSPLPAVPRPSAAAWAALVLVVLFAYFFRLGSLYLWPEADESLMGLDSLQLSRQWDWKFFHCFGQIPPLSIWTVALLWKWGCGSFVSLWLPSALASALTVGMGVLVARQFFPPAPSLLFGFSLAGSYWLFFLSRINNPGVWMPFWACACVFFLGRFFRAKPGFSRDREAFFLGAVAGLGSLTFTPWPAVDLWLLLVLGAWARSKSGNWKSTPFFIAGGILGLAPFLVAVVREGYGQHVVSNGIWSAWLSSADRWKASLSYGTTLLWGSQAGSPYDPAGGGFLNPLQAAAFFLGFLELARRRQDPRAQAALAALVLFLAPGFLSMGHEMCRVAQALPLILGICALGLIVFLGRFAPRRRWALLFLFLAVGAAWDTARVIRFLPRPPLADQRLPQDWEAFQVLKTATDHWGPGLILCDFPADSDESLFVMSYPLNAAENPRLNPAQASWAAVLMDRDYFNFVSPRLAGSQWFWLDPALPGGKNWVLGWVPLTAGNRPLIQRWTQAHHFFWRLNQKIDDINTPATTAEAADFFSQGEALVQGDPFLESCFWERRGEFYYHYGYQEHYEDHVGALRQAIKRGYPAAHLYFKLGSLLLRKGDRAGALGAFRAALKADPHDEEAQAGLNLALSPAPKGPSNPRFAP